MATTNFPKIQGGGSLILAWQVRGRPILVIGGGDVAAGRILNCLDADAIVTVVCPSSGLNPEVAHRVATGVVTHIDRPFEVADLDTTPPPSLVMCAVDDPVASSQVYKECQSRRIPSNIADVPPECDFYFGSVYRDGPLQIMVSTNGNGPRMAALTRRWIGKRLPKNAGRAIVRVGMLRKKLRSVAPAPTEGEKRMKWMTEVCTKWSLEDFCEMSEEDMDKVLTYYAPNEVPSLKEVRGEEETEPEVFDYSFGWWI
ncbi:siroheme synthase domain-containing protein [Microthyrium microscopicum]|uniref:precorrin-2 dehydrogenase n=1 Tax=Microthyrium microscopicum TaxID=703497 RepID=A0A6A6U9Z3_9PEZI|nr:siroheme synthase domain-containing protein [Microthyrium microscopicum]